jgi:hypothetical protein
MTSRAISSARLVCVRTLQAAKHLLSMIRKFNEVSKTKLEQTKTARLGTAPLGGIGFLKI